MPAGEGFLGPSETGKLLRVLPNGYFVLQNGPNLVIFGPQSILMDSWLVRSPLVYSGAKMAHFGPFLPQNNPQKLRNFPESQYSEEILEKESISLLWDHFWSQNDPRVD